MPECIILKDEQCERLQCQRSLDTFDFTFTSFQIKKEFE